MRLGKQWTVPVIAAAFLVLSSMASAGNRVLVIGATGGTGKEVVRQALARGFVVRALVRDETRARATLDAAVELVPGDVRSGEGIDTAMRDVDYVVCALGSNVRNDPENTPERVDYGGVRDLAKAAAAAKVEHFVLVSSMGVTHEDHPLNKMFANILQWKLKGENALRASGVPYTVVRPGGLTHAPGGEAPVRFRQGDDIRVPGRVPRADVATVTLEALGRATAVGKTFELVSAAEGDGNDWDMLFSGLKSDDQ